MGGYRGTSFFQQHELESIRRMRESGVLGKAQQSCPNCGAPMNENHECPDEGMHAGQEGGPGSGPRGGKHDAAAKGKPQQQTDRGSRTGRFQVGDKVVHTKTGNQMTVLDTNPNRTNRIQQPGILVRDHTNGGMEVQVRPQFLRKDSSGKESSEGGPGSGPRKGAGKDFRRAWSKKDDDSPLSAGLGSYTMKNVSSLMADTGGFEHEGTSKDGTKTFGHMETGDKVTVSPDGSWKHKDESGKTVAKGSGVESLESHMRNASLGYDEDSE